MTTESTRYRPGRFVRWIFRARIVHWLYDHGAGRLFGTKLCRLTHTGRRSGTRYRTMLEVLELRRASREVILVSGLGPKADWYRNVHASGPTEVEVGRHRFAAAVRDVPLAEAVEVFERYERRYRAIAPLARFLLGKLAGRRYDGSPAARRELAEALPMVALSPR